MAKTMKKLCRFSCRLLGIASVCTFLAACQQTTPQSTPVMIAPSQPVSGVTPSSFRLPDGAGCVGDVARYRAVMDNDLATGHVSASVHGRVIAEINEADNVCRSGQDAQASRMIRATQVKFGYKAG